MSVSFQLMNNGVTKLSRRITVSNLGRLALLTSLTAVMIGSAPAFAQTLSVTKDNSQCPGTYSEIQQAVNLAPSGATIHVCPGTYTTQVTINKPLKISADSGAVLQPIDALNNGVGHNSNHAITVLLMVTNTSNVTIDGLTVDGSRSSHSTSDCDGDYIGVMFQNASGALTHMAVRNIRFDACGGGEGIFVQAWIGNQNVTITDSSIHEYGKTGIILDGVTSNSDVRRNYITGLGSSAVAQNGIQVSRGAAATVANNFVNNHIYNACCQWVATNILVFTVKGGVTLQNNTVSTAQVGIGVDTDASSVQILSNDVYDSKILDGMLVNGNNTRIANNNVYHSDLTGINTTGKNNVISGNTINEAFFGILNQGTGNQMTANKYYNLVSSFGSSLMATAARPTAFQPCRQ